MSLFVIMAERKSENILPDGTTIHRDDDDMSLFVIMSERKSENILPDGTTINGDEDGGLRHLGCFTYHQSVQDVSD